MDDSCTLCRYRHTLCKNILLVSFSVKGLANGKLVPKLPNTHTHTHPHTHTHTPKKINGFCVDATEKKASPICGQTSGGCPPLTPSWKWEGVLRSGACRPGSGARELEGGGKGGNYPQLFVSMGCIYMHVPPPLNFANH